MLSRTLRIAHPEQRSEGNAIQKAASLHFKKGSFSAIINLPIVKLTLSGMHVDLMQPNPNERRKLVV